MQPQTAQSPAATSPPGRPALAASAPPTAQSLVPEGGKRCGQCKRIKPIDEFGTHKKNPERLLVQCKTCVASKKKWAKSKDGKEFSRKRNADPVMKAIKKKSAQKESCRIVQRAAAQRLEASGKYKARRKEWQNSPNGKANAKRQGKKTAERLRNNPSRRLAWNIRVRMYMTLTGKIDDSATLIRNTIFPSLDSIRKHFEAQLTDDMTLDNYGKVWDIEHKIAVVWYDHSNQEDVYRCWSPENLSPMKGSLNRQKSYKIIDSTCLQVPVEKWPISWNGKLPSLDDRRRMYANVRAGRGFD